MIYSLNIQGETWRRSLEKNVTSRCSSSDFIIDCEFTHWEATVWSQESLLSTTLVKLQSAYGSKKLLQCFTNFILVNHFWLRSSFNLFTTKSKSQLAAPQYKLCACINIKICVCIYILYMQNV